MSSFIPFAPKYGSGQTVNPAAASANSPIEATNNQVRVVNTGSNAGYFRTYNSVDAVGTPALAVATAADVLVMPGMVTTITTPLTHDRIAYISAAGTTFNIMTGEGW